MTIIELARLTEDDARLYLEKIVWPNGPTCPHCKTQNVTRLQGEAHRKGLFQCNDCGCRQQFTVTVGTVMESSKVALVNWIMAFHLLCSSKKGFSISPFVDARIHAARPTTHPRLTSEPRHAFATEP